MPNQIPETVRLTSRSHEYLSDVIDNIDGATDDRGLKIDNPSVAEIVQAALGYLQQASSNNPQNVVANLVEARLRD